jgi:hypothetical protein
MVLGRRLALGVLALCGCRDQFTSGWLVEDLRAIGVRAEPPEITPEGTARVDALVIDPAGEGYTASWGVCDPLVDPRAYTGDPDVDCVGEALLPLDAAADGSVAVVPADVAAAFGIEDVLAMVDADRSLGLRVVLRVVSPHKSITAVKSVIVSRAKMPNSNPAVDELEAPDCLADFGNSLLPVVPIESFELAYPEETDPVFAHEIIDVQFYTDAGRLRSARADLSWTPEGEPAREGVIWEANGSVADPVRFWLVADDHRGGVAWLATMLPRCR